MALRTIGVEEEFLLVGPEDGRPRAVAAALLDAEADESAERDLPDVESELQRQQIETATNPCTSPEELFTELGQARRNAAERAQQAGAALVALGTSPMSVSTEVFPDPRYRRIADRFGMTAQEQLTCGCHVHVGIDSDEEAIGVLDRIRPWLSVLLALSANSPFWRGDDSRYASYRAQVWPRWPSGGPTGPFGSPEAYRATVEAMTATKTILDDGMIYFEARWSNKYPTVEIRVADVCTNTSDAVLLALLSRGLVDTAARSWRAGDPPPEARVELLKLASWRASRSGLDDELVDPRTWRPAPAGEVVAALLEHTGDALAASGDQHLAKELTSELLERGNGAQIQRADYRQAGRLEDIVSRAISRTIDPNSPHGSVHSG
ncbi:carboxylate-amine ligase [Pseudonocardia eucalypti]|uniref:carboxylate-amine ligase n=1 Tax=Pseudonocardia eucalypti TaxID=648755 RepID=UPI00185A193E|nr:carboxylate-amine ligase [Pseudonocardia eucalypti]